MASVLTTGNGLRRIDFFNANGVRKSIRLGRVTKKDAETFPGKIEALNAAKISRTNIDNDTAAWLSELPDKQYGGITTAGLAAARITSEPQRTELAAFIYSYIDSRSDGPQLKRSSAGLTEKLGRSYSKTCEQRGRPNWRKPTQSTSSAPRLATASRLRRSTTFKSPTSTLALPQKVTQNPTQSGAVLGG